MSDAAKGRTGESVRPYPVVIIDDHELFSTTLMISLRSRGFTANKLAISRLPELVGEPAHTSTGLVILDLHLGEDAQGNKIMGNDWIRGLRTAGWQVLVVSGTSKEGDIAAAIAEGAAAVLSKESRFDVLLDAVLRLAREEPLIGEAERHDWQARHRVRKERERYLNERLGKLTPREREVLELLVEGRHAADIATRFVVSLTTVRTQIRSIFTKLEVNSQLEAVAFVRQNLE